MKQSTRLEAAEANPHHLLVLHVLCALEREEKISFPIYFNILGASAYNIAKVEVASSSLVSRSIVSLRYSIT
jgi:hypothetical protein